MCPSAPSLRLPTTMRWPGIFIIWVTNYTLKSTRSVLNRRRHVHVHVYDYCYCLREMLCIPTPIPPGRIKAVQLDYSEAYRHLLQVLLFVSGCNDESLWSAPTLNCVLVLMMYISYNPQPYRFFSLLSASHVLIRSINSYIAVIK